MARITIENYDPLRHGNPMSLIDDAQRERHYRAPTIVPCKVCLVTVCGFTFTFHSMRQLRVCREFFTRVHHPSSRLPVYSGDYGGDHWETQRWYEKLPQYLLESPKRTKVIAALDRAHEEYGRIPEAETGTEPKPLTD